MKASHIQPSTQEENDEDVKELPPAQPQIFKVSSRREEFVLFIAMVLLMGLENREGFICYLISCLSQAIFELDGSEDEAS